MRSPTCCRSRLEKTANTIRIRVSGAYMLGDIVISMERAQEQAAQYGHTLQREVAFLTVHSMLHLLGYDHVDGGLEAVRMREREEAVLTSVGLPRGASYVLGDQ